jgi:hypothetical protein
MPPSPPPSSTGSPCTRSGSTSMARPIASTSLTSAPPAAMASGRACAASRCRPRLTCPPTPAAASHPTTARTDSPHHRWLRLRPQGVLAPRLLRTTPRSSSASSGHPSTGAADADRSTPRRATRSSRSRRADPDGRVTPAGDPDGSRIQRAAPSGSRSRRAAAAHLDPHRRPEGIHPKAPPNAC